MATLAFCGLAQAARSHFEEGDKAGLGALDHSAVVGHIRRAQ